MFGLSADVTLQCPEKFKDSQLNLISCEINSAAISCGASTIMTISIQRPGQGLLSLCNPDAVYPCTTVAPVPTQHEKCACTKLDGNKFTYTLAYNNSYTTDLGARFACQVCPGSPSTISNCDSIKFEDGCDSDPCTHGRPCKATSPTAYNCDCGNYLKPPNCEELQEGPTFHPCSVKGMAIEKIVFGIILLLYSSSLLVFEIFLLCKKELQTKTAGIPWVLIACCGISVGIVCIVVGAVLISETLEVDMVCVSKSPQDPGLIVWIVFGSCGLCLCTGSAIYIICTWEGDVSKKLHCVFRLGGLFLTSGLSLQCLIMGAILLYVDGETAPVSEGGIAGIVIVCVVIVSGGKTTFVCYVIVFKVVNQPGGNQLVVIARGAIHPNGLKQPGKPRKLKIDGVTDNSVTLIWGAPHTGNPPFTYLVQYRPTGEEKWLVDKSETISTPETTVTNLRVNTEYEFRVRANDTLTNGEFTDIIKATTKSSR